MSKHSPLLAYTLSSLWIPWALAFNSAVSPHSSRTSNGSCTWSENGLTSCRSDCRTSSPTARAARVRHEDRQHGLWCRAARVLQGLLAPPLALFFTLFFPLQIWLCYLLFACLISVFLSPPPQSVFFFLCLYSLFAMSLISVSASVSFCSSSLSYVSPFISSLLSFFLCFVLLLSFLGSLLFYFPLFPLSLYLFLSLSSFSFCVLSPTTHTYTLLYLTCF